MKKILVSICAVMLVLGSFGMAGATTYTFVPNPSDIYDLDHHYYYTWGIDWAIPDGEIILGASLFFDNIRNWDSNYNVLWVHLLDAATPGVTSDYDNQGNGDDFADQGIKLFDWENIPATPQDLTHDFSDDQLNTLIAYIGSGGNFGLGFDPDCHYYNDGITLTIITPEPMTILLLGFGFLGLGLARRKS